MIIGKMKDETCGLPIKRFVGLKEKMYTYIIEDNHKFRKAKNLNKNVVDNELKYEDQKNFLFNATYIKHKKNGIQSKSHNIGTYIINKVFQSCYNDKIFRLKDGYRRLSHFHKSTH